MSIGRVVQIFICPDKGLPMQAVDEVLAIAGVGLQGDRYASGLGAWSTTRPGTIRQVSLISMEAIVAGNSEISVPFFPEETRRNIVVEGVDLNEWIGKCFVVGKTRMRGFELCDPCKRPAKVLKDNAGLVKSDFEKGYANRGGLRAEIERGGLIRVGDLIFASAFD
jgi:MOSC domain-containing protein YiiM